MSIRKMLACLIFVFCITSISNLGYAEQNYMFNAKLKITNDFGTETTEFNVGDNINIDVVLNETSQSEYLMYAAQLEVAFDNSYAELVNATPKANGFQIGERSNKVIFAYLSFDNNGITRPGELLVGSVKLKATRDALLNVGLENVKVTNQDTSLRTVEVETEKTLKIGSGIVLADRETLKAKIDAANDTKKNISVSSDGYNIYSSAKWVTQTELDAFNSAISSAASALNKADITQAELESAESALDTAISTFENKIKFGRKSSGGGVKNIIKYTVSFETNGGSSISPITVNNNETIMQTDKPTKTGFIFDGWYTESSLLNKFDITKPVTNNFTLYAKWTAETEDNKVISKPNKWVNPFNDVKTDDWFYDYVSYAVENGLMKGVKDTEFAPDADITRAMFVTVLYRMENEPQADIADFSDIESGSYYQNAVNWCAANKIVNGVTETEFAPNKNITREQMAAIAYRYAEFKGFDLNADAEISYNDAKSISDYAKDAVKWAKSKGIMSGNEDNTFAPNSNSTRAQAAAVFQRIIENLK